MGKSAYMGIVTICIVVNAFTAATAARPAIRWTAVGFMAFGAALLAAWGFRTW